jgi:MFS family permease
MAFIDSTVVNVALPALQSSLGGTVIDMQWVVEAYGLFLGALILVGGSAGDLFCRRRMFLLGVTVFAVASAACGLAQDSAQDRLKLFLPLAGDIGDLTRSRRSPARRAHSKNVPKGDQT